jgi:hypothetical protein
VHARHFRVPLFGGVCRMCGHFPVYFCSRRAAAEEEAAAGGEGGVNGSDRHVVKALQARGALACVLPLFLTLVLGAHLLLCALRLLRAQSGVMLQVRDHVSHGGILVVFPGAPHAPLTRRCEIKPSVVQPTE